MPEQRGLLPLAKRDFSGGPTDFFLGANPTQCEKMDNFIVNDKRDAESRPGSLAQLNYRVNATYTLRSIIDHDSNILMQAGPQVHYDNSGSVGTITGPNGYEVFTQGSDSSEMNFAFWNEQTIGVSSEFTSPQKIFKDAAGNWTVQNLGMPEIILSHCITLANEIKTDYNAHLADTGSHTTGADSANIVSSADATDLASLFTLTSELLTQYAAHDDDAELASGWAYHAAQEGSDHSLASPEAPVTLFQISQRLDDLKEKFNSHEADGTAHGTSSVRQITNSSKPQISSAGGSGNNYLYGFHYYQEYSVEGKIFAERSRVEVVPLEDVGEPSSFDVTINFNHLSGAARENWDMSNVKVRVFRTSSNGSTYFYVGEFDTSTSVFTDDLSDSTIQNNETVYTDGGILDDDTPPPARFCEVVDNQLVLGNVKIGSVIFKNRIRISKPLQLGACPETNFVDFEGEVTGVGKANIYPIIFLKGKCFRLEGSQDSRGVGVVRKRNISEEIGCVSHKSIVNTKEGVYFAAEDGFYFTDGFSTRLISTDRDDSYEALSNKSKIQGCYHKKEKWVIWSVQTDDTDTENDTLWVAHLKFQTPTGGRPIPTWSGGLDPDNFSASAINYIDEVFYRADSSSYLLYHDDNTLTDPFIDTTKTPDNWDTQTITFDYRSVAYDFGDDQARKAVIKLNINAENETTLNVMIDSNNDNSGIFNQLPPIEANSRVAWGDRTVSWKNSSLPWKYFPVITEWRYFPTINNASIRCMYKQIKLSNNYIDIDNSDSFGSATIDSGLNTVTLDAYPASDWIDDPINYFITFESDNFTREYQITDNALGVLTVNDVNATLVNGSDNWRIRGYKKNEKFKLLNYVLSFRGVTMSQATPKSEESV